MSKKSKKPPARELGVANATRGVWLVKVPNYLSRSWQGAGENTDLGLMRISSNPKKVEVTFTLSESLAQEEGQRLGLEIPRQHRLLTQDISSQSLATFSEDSSSGELMAEGKVVQKADIQPVDSDSYMKLKLHQIKAAEKTKFQATQLNATPTNTYKPVSGHSEHRKETEKKKRDGKRARDDRDTVLDLIFTAFQQHQYYNFRDLVHKTKQPVAYLKEILREVCIYNTKAPHKNMWELKPEYRHFNKDSAEAKGDGNS